ncbi:MAG TPA: SAM-dependent methyltransferase [Stellaceae bacterium]|nr:SAM-dependent methyltransferase [Stellaceae bacterium]
MTEQVGDKIARRIRAEGPLTIAGYTAIAMHDPAAGYYATRSPIGAAGDFTTAPEISQIFGELIGLWCADLWQRMGRPDPVIVAELGPGRGVLLSDFLRAAATVPGFRAALRLHLVETSPVLRAEQQRRLDWAQPVWVERFEELPDGRLLLIANEFLDALPIRQLVRGIKHWSERLVALDPRGELVFIEGPESAAMTLLVPPSLQDGPTGTVVEICPAALALAGALGARLKQQPGAALFIDYGYYPSRPGPTFRAVSRHRSASPLAEPGTVDLSADVDFGAFAASARVSGAETYGPVMQGRFLVTLGAAQRLAALSAQATPAQRRMLEAGLMRLLDPAEMGNRFKVLAVVSPGLPAPAGFDGDVEA